MLFMKEKYYVVAKTIARWKLNNPFENWLGQKADTSECWKKYMCFTTSYLIINIILRG